MIIMSILDRYEQVTQQMKHARMQRKSVSKRSNSEEKHHERMRRIEINRARMQSISRARSVSVCARADSVTRARSVISQSRSQSRSRSASRSQSRSPIRNVKPKTSRSLSTVGPETPERKSRYDDAFQQLSRPDADDPDAADAADDDEEEEDEAVFRPCPLDVRGPPAREWCFLCNTAQTQAEIEANPRVARLTTLLDNNYHKTAKDILCDQAVCYYDKELRPYIQGMPEWTASSVWDHITKHAPTPRVAHEQTLETVDALITAITSAGVIGKNCKGEKKVDLQNAKVLLEALKFKTKTLEALTGKRPVALN
jgi:hypothetical protein